jgi:hypothetical protein
MNCEVTNMVLIYGSVLHMMLSIRFLYNAVWLNLTPLILLCSDGCCALMHHRCICGYVSYKNRTENIVCVVSLFDLYTCNKGVIDRGH